MDSVVLLPTTGSQINVTGEKQKGAGYSNWSGTSHTVSITCTNFVGRIYLEASLATAPTEADWFGIPFNSTLTYVQFPLNPFRPTGQIQGDTGSYSFEFVGNYVWIRAKLDRTYLNPQPINTTSVGSVNQVLLNFGAFGGAGSGGGTLGILGPTGPRGPEGLQGHDGPPGTATNTGATGPVGVTGPRGAIGNTGPQGLIGPTGVPGTATNTGATGTQGLTGATGATGPVYTSALIGPLTLLDDQPTEVLIPEASWVVTTGLLTKVLRYELTRGTSFRSGTIQIATDGTFAGTVLDDATLNVGTTGITFGYTFYTNFTDNYLVLTYVSDATGEDAQFTYFEAEWISGPEGPMGVTGPTGYTGATGAASTVTGPTGLTGPTGYTGATGVPGAPSMVTGPTGLIGPTGYTGATGAASTVTGPNGLTGPTGYTGATGASGAPGAPSMVTGPTGTAGLAGAPGATGVTGITGAAGVTGPTGIMGPTGEIGPSGVTGATGYTGPPSLVTGPTGVPGPSGIGFMYEFNIGYNGLGQVSSVTNLPSGWSVLYTASNIIVTHTMGYVPSGFVIWGQSTVPGNIFTARSPNSIMNMSYDVTMPTKFVLNNITPTNVGTVAGGSAKAVVFFV